METNLINNQVQFSDAFSGKLKNLLGSDYTVEADKRIGAKQVDIFISNKRTQRTFLVEIKGQSNKGYLPPEIIPWLEELKEKTTKELRSVSNRNHLIVVSLAKVNDSVKDIFNESGIEVFDYSKHSSSAPEDFVTLLEDIENSVDAENGK